MSSSGFGNLIGRLLRPRPDRIRQQLIELFQNRPGREYTPQQLYLEISPSSAEALALVLDELSREGVVRRVYRVESPMSHSGIKDFSSIEEIPEVLHDWTVDQEIEVDPSFIRPIFKTQNA